jgi:hydrogenase maturation protease
MLKVIGIGNALRGDDAIGPIIIEKLETMELEHPVKLIDAGADAFTVLEHLLSGDPVILVDCAKMGKKAGDVHIFDVTEANLAENGKMVSLHGFAFADTYRMAKQMGNVAPCKIIGVEPKTIAFDTQISQEVEKSIPYIINLVIKEAKSHA